MLCRNNMAKSALNKADAFIRSRSPLYQERVANTPLQMPTNARGMAVVRSVNAQAQPQQDQLNQPEYRQGRPGQKAQPRISGCERFIKNAQKTKREEKKTTAPILNMPDAAVTAALRKAQEAI